MTVTRKNKSSYAILGILSLSPSTGYDIKKYSDRVLSGFWNENFGHIYPTLKRMLVEGSVQIVERESNETKIRYAITEQGRREFAAWLAEETTPQPVRSEFLLKLLFSSQLPRENVAATLRAYRAQREAGLARYREMEKALDEGIQEVSAERAFYLRAVLRNGVLAGEAAIRWCDETLEALGNPSDG